MRTWKEIVQAAINEGIDRKNDLLQELGSVRSGSRASRASISSSALRAHAKGEAAAALKKAELQKKINELQWLNLQWHQNLKRKKDEKTRLLSREESWKNKHAWSPYVQNKKQLQWSRELRPLIRSSDSLTSTSRQIYLLKNPVNSQLGQLTQQDQPRGPELDASNYKFNASNFTVPCFLVKSVKEEKPKPEALPFTPSRTAQASNPTDRMECFIQFMARRELIVNKIEKFDNRPENYNTWKGAFRNMTKDVNVTASEELALMIEYTTGESKKKNLYSGFAMPTQRIQMWD